LRIVSYPHPALRHKSRPVKRVDAELRSLVGQMFDLMYEANGVGLAANQVALPLRLFVANLEAEKGKGEELVFLNPVLRLPKGTAEGEEGCLSLPGLYGQVKRAKQIRLHAYNLQGQEIQADVKGMLARVAQHETDHLDGVLFIDRLTDVGRAELQPELEDLENSFAEQTELGAIGGPVALAEDLAHWERKYCE
jgi:peptide deformylase